MRHSEADFHRIRLAIAAAENPDVRELKRCGFATSSVRFAPCELPMGHKGRCYSARNDVTKRVLEALTKD